MVQEFLTETLLLSLVGCAFGLALTFGGIRLFTLIVPDGCVCHAKPKYSSAKNAPCTATARMPAGSL